MLDKIVLRTTRDGKVFDRWCDIDVDLKLNSVISTAKFSTFVDGIDDEHRKLFLQGACTECTVEILDELTEKYEPLLTGIIINTGLSIQKEPKKWEVYVMSKSGIIANVTLPPIISSMQFANTSLTKISKLICDYYGLELFVHDGAKQDSNRLYKEQLEIISNGKRYQKPTESEVEESEMEEATKEFKKLQAKEGEPCYSFLQRLAKERGITVAHDNRGRVMLYKILNVIEATSEVTEDDRHINMSMSPNWQQMHSHITVKCESPTDEDESTQTGNCEYTAESPFHKGMVLLKPYAKADGNGNFSESDFALYKQPTTVLAGSIEPSELKKYADSLICKEVRNFPLKLEWEGILLPDLRNGGLRQVRAGFFLFCESKTLNLKRTQMVIDEISFSKKAKEEFYRSEATCIHPCYYTGVIPKETIFGNGKG